MTICRPYIYLALWLTIAVNLSWAWLSRAKLAYASIMPFSLVAVLLTIVVVATHYRPDWHAKTPKGLLVSEMLLLTILLIPAFRPLDALTKTVAIPLADGVLTAVDRSLGLDWLSYWRAIHDLPGLHGLLSQSYNLLEAATLLSLTALMLSGAFVRARLMAETLVICTLFSVVIGTAFPAMGPVTELVPDLASYPNFAFTPGVYHQEQLLVLRDLPASYVIGAEPIAGLTTLPSMHTATGIVLLLATWRTWVFVPTVLYCIPMLASTPIWGGHYFIDMIAGTALACAVFAALSAPFALRIASLKQSTPIFGGPSFS